MLKRLILALVLILGLAAPVAADNWDDAVAAHKRGDYTMAFRLWFPYAAAGNAVAQYNFGFMYDEGQGVTQDYSEAAWWYRRAADQGHGHAKAQNNLGLMYAQGRGVPRDYVQAHKWFNLAAANHPSGKERDTAVKNRDILASYMTPAQIAQAQRLAREFEPKFER